MTSDGERASEIKLVDVTIGKSFSCAPAGSVLSGSVPLGWRGSQRCGFYPVTPGRGCFSARPGGTSEGESISFCAPVSCDSWFVAASIRLAAACSKISRFYQGRKTSAGANRGRIRLSRPAAFHPGFSQSFRNDSRHVFGRPVIHRPIEQVFTIAGPLRGANVGA